MFPDDSGGDDDDNEVYFEDKEKNRRFIEFKRKQLEEQRKNDNASLEAKIAKHRAVMVCIREFVELPHPSRLIAFFSHRRRVNN